MGKTHSKWNRSPFRKTAERILEISSEAYASLFSKIQIHTQFLLSERFTNLDLVSRDPILTESLSVKDNRNGKQYEIPVSEGAIKALELRKIKVSEPDFGLMSYDPSFVNTAPSRSVPPCALIVPSALLVHGSGSTCRRDWQARGRRLRMDLEQIPLDFQA